MTSHLSGHPKSSKSTKVATNKYGFLTKLYHNKYSFPVFFVVLWLIATYIFYLRFPNNYTDPNFYAEDGHVLAQSIVNKGFVEALLTTFNGYYVWGLYILAELGFIINHIFFGNEFVNLPRIYSLVSYGFFGLLAVLPVLMFKRHFKPAALFFIVLLTLFVPMQGSDYAIIGVIGNLKFAFIYLAFLLLVYRHFIPQNSKIVYLVDFGLLICAYTNITVYPMMIFALIRYLPDLRKSKGYKKILKDRTFQSLLLLGFALLPQLYIVHHYGIPYMKGYLDTPYNFGRTVEIFISRSYLYTLLFPVNKFLSDILVVVIATTVLGLGAVYSGKFRRIYIFGILTALLASLLFVVKRTGISDSYIGYKSGGPDQFFYPQNWVFGFVLSICVVEVVNKIKSTIVRNTLYIVLILIYSSFLIPSSGSFGKNNFMAEDVGNIYENSKKICSSKTRTFKLPLYPSPNLMYYDNATREQLCTESTSNYYPRVIRFDLAPADNSYISGLGTINKFSQTFVSPQNKLDGVNIYFSTFRERVDTPYKFQILDKNCSSIINTVDIPVKNIGDNEYYLINFDPLTDSKGKTYCFSVKASGTGPADPLAIQLSKPGVYSEGVTMINKSSTERDVVFNLHYR